MLVNAIEFSAGQLVPVQKCAKSCIEQLCTVDPTNYQLQTSSLVQQADYPPTPTGAQLPPPRPGIGDQTDQNLSISNLTPNFENRIKIYPQLAFAAILHKLGGAWQAWTVARWVDKQGRGRITRQALTRALKQLGVNKFARSRWISSAVKCGLFSQYQDIYYLASLGRAAQKVSGRTVRLPVLIDPRALVSRNWRARVWSGYRATLQDKMISQTTLAQLTGVDARTQRNYQHSEPGTRRGNYARTNLKPNQVAGMMENERGCYFSTRRGKVLQRLPDTRNVPFEIATTANPGRSRKGQKVLNSLCHVEQGTERPTRLFCGSPKQLKSTERLLARCDKLPSNKPQQVYQLYRRGKFNNVWDAVFLDREAQYK